LLATGVTTPASALDSTRRSARYVYLGVVVNNAGITGSEAADVPHDPEKTSLADWHAVLATNLDGLAGPGSIINMSSRSGLVGIPGAAAYAASKAAVRNHTKTVALYCAEQGWQIRCNSIHPAAVLTPMWEPVLSVGEERETRMESIARENPLRRFGTVEEIAALAVMLASDEVTYMTGAELTIDGGSWGETRPISLWRGCLRHHVPCVFIDVGEFDAVGVDDGRRIHGVPTQIPEH
jgi:NAD(P)-dependent dehydrogenase (short-subunit alcohol dehydrogenase family)